MRGGEKVRVGMGRGSIGEEGGRERREGGGEVVDVGGGGEGGGGGVGPEGGCKGGVEVEVIVCGKKEVGEVGEICCVDVCGLLKLQRSGRLLSQSEPSDSIRRR